MFRSRPNSNIVCLPTLEIVSRIEDCVADLKDCFKGNDGINKCQEFMCVRENRGYDVVM